MKNLSERNSFLIKMAVLKFLFVSRIDNNNNSLYPRHVYEPVRVAGAQAQACEPTGALELQVQDLDQFQQ